MPHPSDPRAPSDLGASSDPGSLSLSTPAAVRVPRPDPSDFLNPWAHGPLIRYLAWLRQLHSHLPVPAPGRDPREGTPLEELFVEPRIGPLPPPTRGRHGEGGTLSLVDLLERHRQVVLLGDAGSGRTTLCSWIVHALTDPAPNAVITRLGRLVPIILPMGFLELDDAVRTVEGLVARLADMPFWYPGMDELFGELLARGQVLFVLDDLDGTDEPDIRDALRDAILDAVSRYPAASWLVTAEPGGYALGPLEDPADELPPELAELPEAQRPALPTWWLQPFARPQVQRFADHWQQLARPDEAHASAALLQAIDAAPSAPGLARSPAMLALLALVHAARGDLPVDRGTLLDWMVAAWLSALDNVPGAERVPVEGRRAWVEAMARAAEAERIAAWDQWVAAGAPGSLETRVHTPTVPWSQAFYLLRASVLGAGHPDPGPEDTASFVYGVAHRPGVLVARAGGLAFVRSDQQRFLAAVHVAADLSSTADSRSTESAYQTLRGWSRIAADDDLVEIFDVLGARPGLAGRVFDQLLDPSRRPQNIDELTSLGPLALALQDERAPEVPEEVRAAARELVDEAVLRSATERGRVPRWAPSLEALRNVGPLPALDLSGNDKVADLSPLAGQRRMARIDLAGCRSVADLRPLQTMPALRWADMRDCEKVDDIEPLAVLQNLRWLDLGGCTSLTDLRALGGLQGLQALVLHGCTGVTDLTPICAARGLRALVISGCTGITDLSPLARLPPGGTVWVRGSGVRFVPRGLRWSVIGL